MHERLIIARYSIQFNSQEHDIVYKEDAFNKIDRFMTEFR